MANQAVAMRRVVADAPLVRMNPRGIGDIIRDQFFQYASVLFTFTLGNENFQTAIQIQSDADFVIMSTHYTNTAEVSTAAIPFASVSNGGALVQLTDGGTQRFMSNVQVPLNSLFGKRELPHIWEFTHLIRANSSIGINITGMGAVAPFAGQAIRLVFSGMKVPKGIIGTGA